MGTENNIFERDMEFARQYERVINTIYRGVFGCSRIRRSNRNDFRENNIYAQLDRDYGIDLLLEFSSGQKITVQEKLRNNVKYRDLTIEYRNGNGKDCEWHHRCSHFQCYFWINDSNIEYVVINSAMLTLWLEQQINSDEWFINSHMKWNQKHGSAKFLAIPIDRLPDHLFYRKSVGHV